VSRNCRIREAAKSIIHELGLRGKIQEMFRAEAKSKIAAELARGAAARREGLEGRARVCARRAAGAAIREYLDLRGLEAPGSSAYDLLAYLQGFGDVSADIRQAAGRLLARVDEDFTLPSGVDLLAEAGWLAEALEDSMRKVDCNRRGI
jgi:hypothetical protein